MTELSERLELLGLTQYLETFVSEGFDSWETIQDITESDLYVSGDVQSAISSF
jgi:SAM domain (Sterile alpha motif)